MDCWGVGDCIAGEETLNHIGGGQDSASEGVHGRRVNVIESPNTSVGSCSTGCTAGCTLFGLSGQFLNQLGEGHYIADLTAEVISPAYLTPSQGQDANTGLQINAISGDTFPVSQMFRLSVDVPSPSNSAAPGIVTVPIQTSGVPSGYLTTTSGIPASGLTCVWDLTGAGRKMQPYSVVDASHISINLSVALHAGSMIALNGMCGYGIDSIADQVLPQGGNMKIHPIAAAFASISPTQVLIHPATHIGSSCGHAQFNSAENITHAQAAWPASTCKASALTSSTALPSRRWGTILILRGRLTASP